jgi:hypothetical protein
LLVNLAVLLLPGCILPYAYPTVSCVPGIDLGPENGPIHSFRIDVTTEQLDARVSARLHLSHVPLTEAGRVPFQGQLSGTYGYYVVGIAANFPVCTSHTVALTLYRPGYELVEVAEWDSPDKVVWNKAPDLAAQERVLDDLFLTTQKAAHADRWPVSFRQLEPGSASVEHREALLFGATEYERLAADPNAGEVRQRLLGKAQSLRALADK